MKNSKNSKLFTLTLATFIAIIVFLFPTTTLTKNSEWMILTTTNSELPSNYIEGLIIDNQDNAWIGTLQTLGDKPDPGGVAKFDGSNGHYFTKTERDHINATKKSKRSLKTLLRR